MKSKSLISGNESKSKSLVWAQFRKGDIAALEVLYDTYIDDLFAYGMKLTKDEDLVQDAIHDLFVELYKYRSKLSDTTNVKFYLLGALKKKLSRSSKLQTVPLNDAILSNRDTDREITMSIEDSIVAAEENSEKFRRLEKAMLVLTDTQRKGLTLKVFENKAYSEIAQIMGVSEASARTTVYRALKAIRKSYIFAILTIKHLLF
ncbi:RNA polymerase sigma factor [Marinoscillum furvescens]|uniref:RNA polymerase sigma-70 factor (ECF subfamily) n=1 Tax=Marinoscillum furvescens DSM 4134 TaxID=1122208 RepID=A0A3D9L1S4_MARFU|nr:sigma-70 family RNA polymerase sigma factor [Marinoscillum furvescens]RED94663.1 RNA polymerase sigma-70 factor (ECF subfamily) [Marinoscillum furvescens DSM 4134]